ncbi:MAG: 50S ribosomal protein P1 [Candidatus Thermoplasmatota archaeon]|jgi:large subunit ribosomal protein L12|nr:50S ribosomal protein P1 [Candidatus Thermoplasmatota archaeon]
MEYIYSAMLLHSAGQKITEEHVKKVLTAAGVTPDEAKVKALIASLDGVNIDEVIKSAALPVAAAPVAPTETKKEEKKEEKKEKKKEEVSQEEAAAGLSALFG